MQFFVRTFPNGNVYHVYSFFLGFHHLPVLTHVTSTVVICNAYFCSNTQFSNIKLFWFVTCFFLPACVCVCVCHHQHGNLASSSPSSWILSSLTCLLSLQCWWWFVIAITMLEMHDDFAYVTMSLCAKQKTLYKPKYLKHHQNPIIPSPPHEPHATSLAWKPLSLSCSFIFQTNHILVWKTYFPLQNGRLENDPW